MKKSKIKYENILLVIFSIIFIILIFVIGISAKKLLEEFKGSSYSGIQVVDEMEEYGYQLAENNTEYFQKLYYELKDLLNGSHDEDFEEAYAKLVAQLFVADFYDLNSKLDKTNVGGTQFVWESYQESFKNFATDSTGIYYYVENNVDGTRTQKLPEVTEVNVENIETIQYSKAGVEDELAYQIEVTITYKTNLGYPTHCLLVLLHNDKKLEVAEME